MKINYLIDLAQPHAAHSDTLPKHNQLNNKWGQIAASLMNRNGTDIRFKDGGHRIQQNPVLTAAIVEIRDAYFGLFNEQWDLIKGKTDFADPNEWLQKMRDIDYDMITLSNWTFQALQRPNYGLSIDKADEILANIPEGQLCVAPTPLSAIDAAKITGSIIKRSIDTFELVFKREKYQRCVVPHLPLSKPPEASGRQRSQPRDDWRFTA